jgi:hypothetical protein
MRRVGPFAGIRMNTPTIRHQVMRNGLSGCDAIAIGATKSK